MKKNLRKYWSILALYWQESLIYRAELVVWRIIEAMPLLAVLALWIGVYNQGSQIGSFSLNMLLTYYVIGYIIDSSVSVHFEENGVSQVNDGTIARFFVRPFSYVHHVVLDAISWRMFNLIVFTIPVLVLIFVVFRDIILTASLGKILLMMLFLLAALCIEVLTGLAIVAVAFYFEQAKALIHLKWILNGIFGGSLLPLSVYPHWFETLARLLPFQYKFAIPMEIYLGQKTVQEVGIGLLSALVWVLVLTVGVGRFWHRAARKFTAVGT